MWVPEPVVPAEPELDRGLGPPARWVLESVRVPVPRLPEPVSQVPASSARVPAPLGRASAPLGRASARGESARPTGLGAVRVLYWAGRPEVRAAPVR